MGLETKYEYIYYTVVDINQWRRGNEEILGEDGFTWEKAINFINHKLKNSEDKSVNNYRVDYAQYCSDIDSWVRAQSRNKERSVFLQFQDNQPIKLTGEGSMFVLYEEEDVWHSSDEDEPDDEDYSSDEGPDIVPQMDSGVDGLSGAGGRL